MHFKKDESGSVSESEWLTLRNFVTRIVEDSITSASYVALYEFAGLGGFRFLLPFTKNDATGQSTIVTELASNSYSISGQTETWDAMNRVLDDISQYQSDTTVVENPLNTSNTIQGIIYILIFFVNFIYFFHF